MTPTPQAVIDAGRRERERYRHTCAKYFRLSEVTCDDQPTGFVGDHDECRDFIDDVVLKAQLLAYADNLPLSLCQTFGHIAIARRILLELAGDDHG